MSEPTEGRWEAVELTCEDHRGMGWIRADGVKDISPYGASELWMEENRANGRLFAASKDLLEALKGVLRVADRATVEFDAARAAIQRATQGDGK